MVSHFDADCKERVQLKRPGSGFRSPTARMNYKPWARVCLDLIFLCSAVGILVHHVLHIWETQLSEGRRSQDLLWLGAFLAHLSPPPLYLVGDQPVQMAFVCNATPDPCRGDLSIRGQCSRK